MGVGEGLFRMAANWNDFCLPMCALLQAFLLVDNGLDTRAIDGIDGMGPELL